jgi:hypothetical protein
VPQAIERPRFASRIKQDSGPIARFLTLVVAVTARTDENVLAIEDFTRRCRKSVQFVTVL